jgi:hypothetical protein
MRANANTTFVTMEEIVKLATQVVLLLTAVVGLFKLAKTAPPSGEAPKQSKPAGKDGPFDFMFSMLGIYGGIFVPLLFMLGIMWLINTLSGALASKPPQPQVATEAISLDQGHRTPVESQLSVQFAVASSIANTSERDAALLQIVQVGIREKSYGVTLNSALKISSTLVRDQALAEVAEAAVQAGEGATAAQAIARINAFHSRDQAAKRALAVLNAVPASGPLQPAPK